VNPRGCNHSPIEFCRCFFASAPGRLSQAGSHSERHTLLFVLFVCSTIKMYVSRFPILVKGLGLGFTRSLFLLVLAAGRFSQAGSHSQRRLPPRDRQIGVLPYYMYVSIFPIIFCLFFVYLFFFFSGRSTFPSWRGSSTTPSARPPPNRSATRSSS